MSSPTQTCQLCGLVEVVRMDGRGFPPDIAKRRLKKRCAATGCPSEPRYLAGFSFGGPARGMSSTRPASPENPPQPTTSEPESVR